MPRLSKVIAGGALPIIVFALSSCGGSTPVKPQRIAFGSPAITESRKIPVRYTCDGHNISLPLVWGPVPLKTRELVVVLYDFKIIPSSAGKRSFQVELAPMWAVTRLSPTLRALPPGKLPPGAHVGFGPGIAQSYSVCPARGQQAKYLFRIYALSRTLASSPAPNKQKQNKQAGLPTAGYGEFIASYKRA